jgi:hypothetical protein
MTFPSAALMAVLLMLFNIGCEPVAGDPGTADATPASAAARGIVFLMLAGFVAVAERRRRGSRSDEPFQIPPPPSSRGRLRL